MNKFFTSTASLSAYTKWVLIRLITGKIIGDELSKADLIKLGCPHNKFKKVIEELQEINAISKLEVEHFKPGRPTLSYTFIYNSHDKTDRLKFTEMLAKLEGLKLRVPIKLVWCFFVLNQDEFGHIENSSLPTIANKCGLKNIEVKTAVTKLIEHDLITQLTRGCTYKKYDLFTHNKHKCLTKRPSAYLVSLSNLPANNELISTSTKINFDSVLSVITSDKNVFIRNIIESLFSSKSLFLNNNIRRILRKILTSDRIYDDLKSYLDMQPENVLYNFKCTLLLMMCKSIKAISSNQKSLSIIHVSNSLFGTRDIFNMNSNLFYLCSFITLYINLYSHSFLFYIIFSHKKFTSCSIRRYKKLLHNIKIDILIKSDKLFIITNASSCPSDVISIYYSRLEKSK